MLRRNMAGKHAPGRNKAHPPSKPTASRWTGFLSFFSMALVRVGGSPRMWPDCVEFRARSRIPVPRLAQLLLALLILVLPSAGALANPVNASIVVDGATGKVLLESNADVLTYPASLTKMMTLYLVFEAMEKGTLKPDQPLLVSANAASQAPTKLGLWAGETITVEQCVRG